MSSFSFERAERLKRLPPYLFAEIDRMKKEAQDEGWDIITVTLRKADLARIPESRIHTALEASTNCEVHIITVD